MIKFVLLTCSPTLPLTHLFCCSRDFLLTLLFSSLSLRTFLHAFDSFFFFFGGGVKAVEDLRWCSSICMPRGVGCACPGALVGWSSAPASVTQCSYMDLLSWGSLGLVCPGKGTVWLHLYVGCFLPPLSCCRCRLVRCVDRLVRCLVLWSFVWLVWSAFWLVWSSLACLVSCEASLVCC